MFGCRIVPYDELASGSGDLFADVTVVEPYCTQAALLEERCGVDPSTLLVPPDENTVSGATAQTYSTEGGDLAGTFMVYVGSAGPSGVASSLLCADGSTENFSAAEWDDFNSPVAAAAGEGERTPATTKPAPTTTEPSEVLAPARVPSAVAVCRQELTPTANGNAAPLSCADGAVNAVAWEYLAANEPSLMTLGTDATFDEVAAAACADVPRSTNSTVISTYEIAAAYYGWDFPSDPTAILYSEKGCPP